MRLLLKLGAGLLARFLGLLTERFAEWLFQQVSEGAEDAGESLADICSFGRWFIQDLAAQLGGRRRRLQYGDDYEQGLFEA